jgi:flagellar hook-associated protein 1 FlgK
MRSTFGGLEIAKRGLVAQQTALNTTGHNIANANTPGYTRQRVDLQASRPLPYPGMTNEISAGQTGTGVVVYQISRLRDEFLDRQYRNENKYVGYYESRMGTYSKIETILKEGTGEEKIGLQPAMDRLWSSWQDLVNGAESGEVREAVVGNAKGLIDVFTHITQSFKEYQKDLDHVVEVKVQEINSIAARLSDINAQIARLTPHGYTTNDLNDQRDLLLDQLSKLVDIQVTPGQSGMINVSIAGQELVNGTQVNQLAAVQNPATGFFDVTIGGAPLTPVSGSLLETLESRGIAGPDGKLTGVIPDLMAKFDTLASVLSKEINAIHRNGKNLEEIRYENSPSPDPANPPKSGLPFFISKQWYEANKDNLANIDFSTVPANEIDPKGADDLMVNPLIAENTDLIAAASNKTGVGVADGTNAQAIADLKNKVLTTADGLPNSNTLDGYYASIIGQIGVDAQHAENLFNTKNYLVNHVDNRRQSVSGVSLDEEMVDMIRFQQAYAAAARTITTMDQMLDKIINGMGVVGR